jgi:HPt (histidine-containing phosphotransfer) domain-containing protein
MASEVGGGIDRRTANSGRVPGRGDFRASAERLAVELRPAIHDDDRPTIARVAHTIKSSAGTVGFADLSVLADRVEAGARARTEHDPKLVARFADLLDRTIRMTAEVAGSIADGSGGGLPPR